MPIVEFHIITYISHWACKLSGHHVLFKATTGGCKFQSSDLELRTSSGLSQLFQSLRYLGVLGDKCTNFPKWPLFRLFIAMLFSLHQDIIGYPYE